SVSEQSMPHGGGFPGGLGGRAPSDDQLALTLYYLQSPADDLPVIRTTFGASGDDAPTVAEVEPQEDPLARRGGEGCFDLRQWHAARGDVLDLCVVSNEVILTPHDRSVPGHVGEHGVIGLNARERGLDRFQDGPMSRLGVGEAPDVLGRELASVRTEQ